MNRKAFTLVELLVVVAIMVILIGRPDTMGAVNFGDVDKPAERYWVSINPQTGRVFSTECMGRSAADHNGDGFIDETDDILNARRFAIEGTGAF